MNSMTVRFSDPHNSVKCSFLRKAAGGLTRCFWGLGGERRFCGLNLRRVFRRSCFQAHVPCRDLMTVGYRFPSGPSGRVGLERGSGRMFGLGVVLVDKPVYALLLLGRAGLWGVPQTFC